MTYSIVIESNSNIRQYCFPKNIVIEEDFYKKAGFKVAEGFKCHHIWKLNNGNTIHLYGKIVGRANQENKYEFPPPVDNVLFFGSCFLVMKNSEDNYIDLLKNEWEKIYEKLYGGFEDLTKGEIDDEEEEENAENEDEYANLSKTKSGYAKDGFIIDDESNGDEDYEPIKKSSRKKTKNKSGEESVEASKPNNKTKKTEKKSVTKNSTKNNIQKQTVSEEDIPDDKKNCYLDCDSELSEEEYL
jgi:hypothetical protein